MEPDLPGSIPKERKNGQYKLDGGRECRGLFCTQGATLTLASQKGNGQEELEEAALQGSNAGPWNQEKAVMP